MYKNFIAIIFAAGCAAVFVGILPPPAPAAAAVQTGGHDIVVSVKSDIMTPRADPRRAGCVQPWPYYEASCLHDSRRGETSIAAVRMISLDKSTRHYVQNVQR
jgi:hypothetical protein